MIEGYVRDMTSPFKRFVMFTVDCLVVAFIFWIFCAGVIWIEHPSQTFCYVYILIRNFGFTVLFALWTLYLAVIITRK